MKQFRVVTVAALIAALVTAFAASGPARAEPTVVVELFTSQGCYSCPPADEILGKLAQKEGIVALALHVDYWDYLGWRDTFAQSAFTRRQFDYRDAMGERVVYTPQMIVQGVSPVTGSHGMSVKDAIAKVRSTPDTAIVEIFEAGGGLRGRIEPVNGGAKAVLYVAKYTRKNIVNIERGENRGKALSYHNVVGMLSKLHDWSGEAAYEVDLPQPGAGEGIALWLQSGGAGPILSAAKFER